LRQASKADPFKRARRDMIDVIVALGRKIHDCNGDSIPSLMVDTECFATSGHNVPTCLFISFLDYL